MKTYYSRRKFLQTTVAGGTALALSARSYSRIIGANDRISIGIIGCGGRGINSLMAGVSKYAESENVEVTAVCDAWRLAREAASVKAKEWFDYDARQFVSYRSLLALQDVDAVMIASCDHQHSTHLEAAALAGKDIYCEKPLAMDLGKLKKACDAVKA